MAEILSNCNFDLSNIEKLYIGNVQTSGDQISYPISYHILTNRNIATIGIQAWATDNTSVTIGGQEIVLYEVLNLNNNITLSEELLIDNRNQSYQKTLSFNLTYIDSTLLKDSKTLLLTNTNNRLTPVPTIAFLIDGNQNKICVGYDNPLFLRGLGSVIGDDNLITYTMDSISGSRIRYYDLPECDLSGTFVESVCPSPTPSVTPSLTPSPTITPTTTPSISISPSPTPSLTPSITPSITPTLTPTVTPTTTPSSSPPPPSATPSVTPTYSPGPTPSNSPVAKSLAYDTNGGAFFASEALACADGTPETTCYLCPVGTTTPSVGDYIYLNSNCTSGLPYQGSTSLWYMLYEDGSNKWALQVSNSGSGYITVITDCSTLPSPTPTPSITVSTSVSKTPTPTPTPSVTPTFSPGPTPSASPVAKSVGYNNNGGSFYSSSANACAEFNPAGTCYLCPVGTETPEVGDYLYLNSNCTSGLPWAGTGNWYYIQVSSVEYAVQVSSGGTGYISAIVEC